MTAPYAKAVVEAELRWGNVGTEFERRVRVAAEKAAKAAQKHFDRIKLAAKVDLKADTGLFSRETREKLKAMKFAADVTLRADTARFHADVRRAIQNLPEANVKVTLDAGSIQSFVAGIEARLRSARITAPVFLEVGNEAAFRAHLAFLTRPVTQTVNIVTNGGGAGSGGAAGSARDNDRLSRSLGRVAASGLKIAGVSALIGAIGGAAGIAAGAVGALVAGLGAVGLAGVAGLATTLVGMKGIGDAFSAFSAETESATSDAEAQAKKVASARKGVEQANRGVEQANRGLESAEKTVARANKDSQRAQEDLSQAREDAVRQIEDLNFALKGTAIDERDAELALARAREAYDKTFADPAASALDRADAALGVDKALRRQEETMRRNADIEKDAREASEKGVEQSDQVVAAKEKVIDAADRVKDAEQGVADAQVGVADAQQAVVDAQADLQEAMDSTSSAADKTAQALAKLSPNARAFVLAMRELGPEWEAVRKSVQDNMFAGLDVTFTNLAQTSMPMLKEGMGQVGTSINGAAKEFAAFWGSAGAQDSLRNIFAGTADLITAMQPGLAALTTGMLDIGNAAAPVMGQLGDSLGNLLGSIGEAFTEAFADGSLTELIGHFSTMMDGLGGGLNALLGGLIDFGNIVGPVLGPLLQTFGESIAMLAPSLGALGVSFGNALIEILPTLSEFISSLADGLAPVMPVIADLLKSLGAALTPLIPPLSRILQTVGTALVGAIDALAPAIGPLGEAFASLIDALAPILPMVAEVISVLVQALAPALKTIFDALGPVIKQWLDGMKPVLEQLAPILAEVAMQLGQAIADALIQLMPVLPTLIDSFSQIVLAIAPFIPQLVQIAAELLPKLIEVIVWLVNTILPPLTKAIVWIAEHVLPLVIEGIRNFAQTWGDKLTQAKDAMQKAKDFLSDRFEDVKSALTSLKEFFSSVVDGIGNIWDGLKAKVAAPINFIIDTVLNNGLGKAWNAVHSILGLPAWPTIDPIGEVGGKAPGNIGDQMIHRRDGGAVFGAGGPREDKIPAWLSNNEHVWTAAEVNAAGGHKAVERIRNGVLAGNYRDGGKVVGGKGPARFAIGGGVMFGSDADTWMSDVIQNTFPEVTVTSALRPGHSGFHGRGQAVDIDGPNKQQYANWIYEAYPQSSQLIWGPGPLLYNVGGQSITDQNQLANQVYAGDLPGHFDHVHWANSMPLGELSEDQKKSLWDRVKDLGGAVVNSGRNMAANLFEAPVKALRSQIPTFDGLGLFGQVPLALYDKMSEAALRMIRGKSQSVGGGGGGDVPYDKSSGAEQWRPLVEKLFDEKGIDRSLVDKYLYQIQRESGGNPNAINDWDINAQNGVPSKGLAQVIDPTFESFKDPGFDNIWDPEANLRASLNYLLRDPKFGGQGVGALTGAGYDQGGIANGIGVMPKFTLQPERVLSPEMTADFERLISVLERPDFIDVLRQITSDAVTNAATAASVSSGATAPAPEVNIAAAASGPSTAFDPNNTGYDDTYYNDTVARGGKEGADAWLARQDFGPQIRTWGINALKEIGGEFASPLGLERRWGEAVDQGAKDAMRASTGGGNTYNITQEFHGYNGTPQQFLAEVEREARRGMTALTPV